MLDIILNFEIASMLKYDVLDMTRLYLDLDTNSVNNCNSVSNEFR